MTATAFRPGIWDHDIACNLPTEQRWLWHGFLAPGRISLLTSLWKSGKTTLLSLLLARRKQGGSLAGQAILPGKTAVVSEEDLDLWNTRRQRLDFGGQACFFCQPFDARPSFPQWLEFLDHLLDLRQAHGLDLLVIDPLASFLPLRNENNAGLMLEALQPLRRLTRAGLAVLLMHHPRKGLAATGQASRGSGALPAFVDIFVEMTHPGGNHGSRRRALLAFSRFRETPRKLFIELNHAEDDYILLPDDTADDFRAHWDVLLMILEDAKNKLTRRQILDDWPPDFPHPTEPTLWKWLCRACDLGLLLVQGTGRKNDPFRYWLPQQEQKWQNDPIAQVLLAQDFVQSEIDKLEARERAKMMPCG